MEKADDLREAIAYGADVVMLDNQTPESLRELVILARSLKPDVVLEASGGVTLENLRAVAESGVDIISTSAITMGAPGCELVPSTQADGLTVRRPPNRQTRRRTCC